MNRRQIIDNNRDRAGRATDALINYNEDDEETGLRDLLADAMHLLGPEAVFDAIRMAEVHYNAELVEG